MLQMHTAVLGVGINKVNRAITVKPCTRSKVDNHFYMQWVSVACCVMVGWISLCDIKQAGSRAQPGLGLNPLKLIAENERSFMMSSCMHEVQSNMEGG